MNKLKIIKRPWGFFKQFFLNERATLKILTVNPHEELSLQKHKKRDENWYFLTEGILQLGNKKFKVKKGKIIKIKRGVLHKLIAKNKKVEVLEISFGKFNEKDEIRINDKYGRR